MKRVTLWNKDFVPYISEEEILTSIRKSAEQINARFAGVDDKSAPIFISVLNGAFIYTSDLMKELNFPCQVSFVKVASYIGDESTGVVKEMIGLNTDIEGRDVVIVDDIIDSGTTMKQLVSQMIEAKANSVMVAALIYKKHVCREDLVVDFPCITMTDDAFIVGYGLDYDQLGRNFRDIYIAE